MCAYCSDASRKNGRTDSENGSEEAESGNLFAKMTRFNQGIDRSPAKRGGRDDTKFSS